MGWSDANEELTPERARRAQVARRTVGVLLLVAAITALLVGRCAVSSGMTASSTLDGAAGVARALAGDESGWAAAAGAYEGAMREGLFDPYPYFARSLVDRLRTGAPAQVPAGLAAMVQALRERGFDAAEEALARAPDFEGQALAWRFLGELRQAELRRRTPDGP